MHAAAKQMMSLGFSMAEVSQMASTNPAKLIRLDNERGSIDVGKRADLVAIGEEGDIQFTMIGGEIVEEC
jgi:N-acetylglucosamine-6-phosphate deacetylase